MTVAELHDPLRWILCHCFKGSLMLFLAVVFNVGSTNAASWIIRPCNYPNPPGVSMCEIDLLAHSCKETTVEILFRYSKITKGGRRFGISFFCSLDWLWLSSSDQSWLSLMSFVVSNFHLFSGVDFPLHSSSSSSSSHPQSPKRLPLPSFFLCSLLLMFVTGHACL